MSAIHSTSTAQFHNERAGKTDRVPDEGRPLPPRRDKGKGSGAEDVQHLNRTRIQFSSHPAVTLVDVVSKVLSCSPAAFGVGGVGAPNV